MKASYSEKLKDPRWQKRRLDVLERCEWTCASCKSETDELHVHHRWYVGGREPWEYPDIALICLCKKCHDDIRKEESDVSGSEWETLMTCLYEANELVFDGVSIAYELSGRIDQGYSREKLRDAIELMLRNDAEFSRAMRMVDERRAERAARHMNIEPAEF